MSDTPVDLPGYGGFTLGGMSLALPMDSLREVLPLLALLPMPCPAVHVIGGIDLRGVMVPVLDLRLLLGRPAPKLASPSVVVMIEQGRILGLLTDGVNGIFRSRDQRLHPARVTDAVAAVLAGSLFRDDDQSLVNVLDPAALAALPQVPMVDDPEPERQQTSADHEAVGVLQSSLPLMLIRCGVVPLALDAMSVHATLASPVIERSALAMGDCRGVIDYAGLKLPAVDLMALCGLGPLPADGPLQAFVLRLERGMVACLVQQVMDVVSVEKTDVLNVPTFALPHPTLFRGAVPASRLAADVLVRTGVTAQQFLLLDGDALLTNEVLVNLGQTNAHALGDQGSAEGFDAAMTTGLGRAMITYALGGETATPIDQVCEILPYTCDVSLFQNRGALLGMLVNRGRTIPVMCLSRLAGFGAISASPSVSILVVESGPELVGFAVPALRTIEPADWEPELPQHGAPDDALARELGSRRLAQVGQPGAQRLLRTLDLRRIADALREQMPLAA
ncbi:MAG: hypothetical protein CFE46_17605 [Burkholderiales bacterium PBB6]|nr:MAG: hypothetical protein CFE46_17605 [Burkholderiales bacterium PBB6]